MSDNSVTVKACVFSDSHGHAGNMITAIELEKPDMIFFLGDGERDIVRVEEKYPDIPVYAVRGNCDFRTNAESTLCFEAEGVTIFMTHGHMYYVKSDYELETLTSAAAAAGADIALFGHTHAQHLSENRGVTLLNPGSCGRGWYPGYAVLYFENGKVFPQLKSL